ncbi:MAG: glycosyltransferase family 2 protein [Eubacteriales bacterium]|nr:glycosyltransferase family 2 protein [Eubacteriales bacterium]
MNERIFRYLSEKTGSRGLSLVASYGIRFCMDTALTLTALFAGRMKPAEGARELVEGLCKKPEASGVFAPLQPGNKDIDLSVIVPAYNAGKYIAQCIDSILNQKTAYRLEVIAVNDDSTDDTLEILKGYGDRIRVIDFKDGHCAARSRNKGLLYATGKYVMFVDADDTLTEDCVEKLLNEAYKKDADVVQGSWRYLYEDGSLGGTQVYRDVTYTGKDRQSCFDLPGMPWGKVFKRELFSNVRFPENYKAFEDTIVQFAIFRKASVITSISDVIYCWRKTTTGITATSQNTSRAFQSYWIVEEMIDANDNVWKLPRDKEFMYCLASQLSNYCYVNVRGLDEEKKRAVFTLCRELYEKNADDELIKEIPFFAGKGAYALKTGKFALWKLQGELSRFLR